MIHKHPFLRVVLGVALTNVLLASCLELPEKVIPDGAKTVDNMTIPVGFNFETTEEKVLAVTVLDNRDNPLAGVPVQIFPDSFLVDEGLIASGITDENGNWSSELSLEAWRTSVVVHTPFIGLPFDRVITLEEGFTKITLGGSEPVEYEEPQFAASSGDDGRVQRIDQTDNFSSRYVYIGTYNNLGVPNYLEPERDAVPQDILDLINNTLPEGSEVPSDNPQYIPEGVSADTRLEDSAAVWVTFVHEGAGYRNALGFYKYDLSNPPETTGDIDSLFIIFPNASFLGSGGGLRTGDKVHIGNFSPNTGIGWFLVNDGWNSNQRKVNNVTDTKWSNPSFNIFTTASNRQHVALLHDPERDLLLLGMEDIARPGGDKDFNDAVFYVTANPFEAVVTTNIPLTKPVDGDDDDEDGVIDINDAYPNDPTKAFDSFSPGENVYGSLAFEDLWPKQGDYDMNDLVVDYNVHFMTNVANEVAEMRIQVLVKALGGSFKNGFGIELDCLPSDIQSVTGSQLTQSLITLSGNGTEAGQAKAVIFAFDDGHKYAGATGGAFVNTEDNGTTLSPDTIELVITFATPIPKAQLGYAPFNPFIFINGNRGRELHLKNFPPTSLMDTTFFGLEEDNSNPAAGHYYQTQRGMPWAIQLPAKFTYPKEKVPVHRAHLKFIQWVESGGGSFADWYLNKGGYRDQNETY